MSWMLKCLNQKRYAPLLAPSFVYLFLAVDDVGAGEGHQEGLLVMAEEGGKNYLPLKKVDLFKSILEGQPVKGINAGN